MLSPRASDKRVAFSIDLVAIEENTQQKASRTWALIYRMCYTRKQEMRNMAKDPTAVSLFIILSRYILTQHISRLYLRYYLLRHIINNNSWECICDKPESLSVLMISAIIWDWPRASSVYIILKSTLELACQAARQRSVVWLYDNIQIAQRIKKQRMSGQNQF